MGSFLMMTCFLCTTISSGMFITAMAANPLAVNLATEALGQTISWGEAQPCLLSVLVQIVGCLTTDVNLREEKGLCHAALATICRHLQASCSNFYCSLLQAPGRWRAWCPAQSACC